MFLTFGQRVRGKLTPYFQAANKFPVTVLFQCENREIGETSEMHRKFFTYLFAIFALFALKKGLVCGLTALRLLELPHIRLDEMILMPILAVFLQDFVFDL